MDFGDERRFLPDERGHEVRIQLVCRRVATDQIPVPQRVDDREQVARQILAAGSQKLRVGAPHAVDGAAQQLEPARSRLRPGLLPVGPGHGGLDGRRVTPDLLRVSKLVQCIVIELDAQQRLDEGRVGR